MYERRVCEKKICGLRIKILWDLTICLHNLINRGCNLINLMTDVNSSEVTSASPTSGRSADPTAGAELSLLYYSRRFLK